MSTPGHADQVTARFRSGQEPIVGTRSAFAFLPGLELVAASGVDYVYLDRQHGPISLIDVWTLCAALARHDLLILVRVSERSATEIGAVLDAGAHGVIVPDVSTPEQATELLQAIHHPPRGTRSWGSYAYDSTGYGGPSARTEDPLFLPMIESTEGVENAEKITSVPGVDAIYVGRHDLALSLRVDSGELYPGGAHHDVVQRIRVACDKAGIRMATTGSAGALLEEGFRMLTLGSELDLLRRGLIAARAG